MPGRPVEHPLKAGRLETRFLAAPKLRPLRVAHLAEERWLVVGDRGLQVMHVDPLAGAIELAQAHCFDGAALIQDKGACGGVSAPPEADVSVLATSEKRVIVARGKLLLVIEIGDVNSRVVATAPLVEPLRALRVGDDGFVYGVSASGKYRPTFASSASVLADVGPHDLTPWVTRLDSDRLSVRRVAGTLEIAEVAR